MNMDQDQSKIEGRESEMAQTVTRSSSEAEDHSQTLSSAAQFEKENISSDIPGKIIKESGQTAADSNPLKDNLTLAPEKTSSAMESSSIEKSKLKDSDHPKGEQPSTSTSVRGAPKPYIFDYTRPKKGRKHAKIVPLEPLPDVHVGEKSEPKERSSDSRPSKTSEENTTIINVDILVKGTKQCYAHSDPSDKSGEGKLVTLESFKTNIMGDEKSQIKFGSKPSEKIGQSQVQNTEYQKVSVQVPSESEEVFKSFSSQREKERNFQCLTEVLEKIVQETASEVVKTRDCDDDDASNFNNQEFCVDLQRPTKEITLNHVTNVISTFKEDEKLLFSEKILNSNNLSGFFCNECEELYCPNNLPYELTCGHNACGNCLKRKREIFCKICTMGNIKSETEIFRSPNRDLFKVSLMFQKAVLSVEELKLQTKNTKYLRRNDLMLFGLENIFRKANLSVELVDQLEEFIETRVNGIKKGFDAMGDAADVLISVKRESLPGVPAAIFRTIDIFSQSLPTFINHIKEMDRLTILSLQEAHLELKKYRDIQVHEINLSKEVVKSLHLSKLECYGQISTHSGRRYCKLSFNKGRIFAHCFKKDLEDEENAFLLYYESLQNNCILYGVFFSLEFSGGNYRSVYFEIYDSSLLARQIYLLCSGEYGPSYKGGTGYCVDNQIIIQGYIKEGKECFNDYLYGIPDKPGNYEVPTSECVTNDRLFGNEAEIVINKYPGKEPKFCLGKLLFGYPSRMPTGKFVIKECGIMFSLPEFQKVYEKNDG